MKRLTYVLLISVAAFAVACSKHVDAPDHSDSPSLSNSYIFFEPEVVSSVETRTTMVSGDRLPDGNGVSFGVMGYTGNNSIFYDQTYRPDGIAEVYRDGSAQDSPFKYTPLAKWASGSAEHNFYAFYPYNLNNLLGVNNKLPYIDYTQPTDPAQMVDILTAATGPITKEPIVDLEFTHRLWALDITVKNARVEPDSLYNQTNKKYDEYTPIIKVKSVKIEFRNIPSKASINLDGSLIFPNPVEYCKDFSKTYSYATPKELDPTTENKYTVNGTDSFLFLPCASFDYRLTIEFENVPLGLSYTAHHPATFVADENGFPVLDDDKNVQWRWATAEGPGAGGFAAGNKYTLDVVKSDFNLTCDWGKTTWEEVTVDHEFN